MPIVAAEEEGNGDLQSGNRGPIYARDSDREAVAPQRHRYQQGDQRSAPADSATWWRNEHRVEESEKEHDCLDHSLRNYASVARDRSVADL
jgi:hypothetical protein